LKTFASLQPPKDPAQLPGFLREVQAAIEQAAQRAEPFMQLQVLYAAPSKTFPAMLVYADGTTWNPGSGEGVYRRNLANSAWNYLG
jgi:hypothetical protein